VGTHQNRETRSFQEVGGFDLLLMQKRQMFWFLAIMICFQFTIITIGLWWYVTRNIFYLTSFSFVRRLGCNWVEFERVGLGSNSAHKNLSRIKSSSWNISSWKFFLKLDSLLFELAHELMHIIWLSLIFIFNISINCKFNISTKMIH
jgi:hypothetical protein